MSAFNNDYRGIKRERPSWFVRWARHQQMLADHDAWRAAQHHLRLSTLRRRRTNKAWAQERWSWWEIAFLLALGIAAIATVLR